MRNPAKPTVAVGSSPTGAPSFRRDNDVGYRHEVIPQDQPDCPYLERWVLGVGIPGRDSWFSLRLHHFFRSDEDHLHDHPGWFWTLVLKGSYEDWGDCACAILDPKHPGYRFFLRYNNYIECYKCGGSGQRLNERMTPGVVRYRPALHRHRVVTNGCWTLVLFGRRTRDWGFYVNGDWLRQRAYFRRFRGSAACD